MNKISSLILGVLPLLLMVGGIIVVDKAHHHPVKTEVTVGPVVVEPVQITPAPILNDAEAIVRFNDKFFAENVNVVPVRKKHHHRHKKSLSHSQIIIGQWKWRLNGTQ